ncbi:MAG TPA: cytochrome c [Pyrinomonadaceae bacterium]|nr:cytochrome c [Pyrinomonadaceae bacterium]
MKSLKAFVFLISVSVLVVIAAGAATGASTPAETKKSRSQISKGRRVYAANCARCHGGDGMGKTTMGEMTEAPNLSDAEWQSRRSTSRMVASVANGRGQMPAFKKKLSKQDIAATIAYIRTLKR